MQCVDGARPGDAEMLRAMCVADAAVACAARRHPGVFNIFLLAVS